MSCCLQAALVLLLVSVTSLLTMWSPTLCRHKGKFGHEFLEMEFRSNGQVCVRAAASLLPAEAKQGMTREHLRCLPAAAVCQQLTVQERHHDSEGGVCHQDRAGGAEAHHQ